MCLKVLMVEDNATDRTLWKRFLSQAGDVEYQFAEEHCGRDGLRTYDAWRPDCVLLDFNLPDMDGIEFLEGLHESPHVAAVVFATAFGNEQIAVGALKAGATDYLVKDTVTPEALRHAIESAVQRRDMVLELQRQRLELEERNIRLEQSEQLVREALARERDARLAAEESEARTRILTEAIPQIVWTACQPCSLDYVNPRWTELTGAGAHLATGSGWLEFLHPEDRATTLGSWRKAAETRDAFQTECRLKTADGAHRHQLIRGIPVASRDGAPAWIGTLTDIEDQKRAAELDYHRQKLESIGLLAGGIAHDFNNLLVGVMGGVSYALDLIHQPDSARPMLETALRASERAAHLVRQMLAYAGKGTFVVREVDLSQVVTSTCELLRASIARTVQFQLATPPGLPPVLADPSQIEQLVMNLLINGAEAIGDQQPGVITVRTCVKEFDGEFAATACTLARGRYVALEVTDTGCGMDEQMKARIFDPFFTTKFTGRGLGLAAVLGIARSNSGAVEVVSVPGAGSTFTVLLPAAAAAHTEPARTEPAVARRASTSGSVLIIDDEEVVLQTARSVLRRAGYAVQTAASAYEAVEIAATQQRFSLAVLDMSMPDATAEEILRQVRAAGLACPVVISSGHSEQEMLRRFGSEAAGYLQKPYTSRTLVEIVDSFHTRRAETQAARS